MRTSQDFNELSPRQDERNIDARGSDSDRIQARIADKLHQAADNLFGRTDGAAPRDSAAFESQARSWLHNSADYIERLEPQKVKADLTEQVRRNPGRSLLVAGAAGLILGAIFRRR
ncbi:MAG: hypothetical protein ABI882_13695 [Acidobacteriota bacterium]